jgi:hypothetical protein
MMKEFAKTLLKKEGFALSEAFLFLVKIAILFRKNHHIQ